MKTKRGRKLQTGAGLVEYALILVLVAVGAITILSLAGVGVQRLYGVVGGAMGLKKDANDGAIQGQVINITGANCLIIAVGSAYDGGIYAATGSTTFVLKVDTNVDLTQLNTAGTENTLMMDEDTVASNPVPPPALSNLVFKLDSVPYPDASACPSTAIVQSVQGSIAVSPVEVDQIP
jgi:Flp pilus assembly pilin Flp